MSRYVSRPLSHDFRPITASKRLINRSTTPAAMAAGTRNRPLLSQSWVRQGGLARSQRSLPRCPSASALRSASANTAMNHRPRGPAAGIARGSSGHRAGPARWTCRGSHPGRRVGGSTSRPPDHRQRLVVTPPRKTATASIRSLASAGLVNRPFPSIVSPYRQPAAT